MGGRFARISSDSGALVAPQELGGAIARVIDFLAEAVMVTVAVGDDSSGVCIESFRLWSPADQVLVRPALLAAWS